MASPVLAMSRRLFGATLWLVVACYGSAALAAVGMAELPPDAISGPVTVFYPTDEPARPQQRGPFSLDVAVDAQPAAGSRRLVVISHGSPASPWVYFDLARTLVDAGFVVALPEHHADNHKDDSEPGPPSWRRRPLEVSRAIDRLQAEHRFGLDLSRVGMYGMSAGGHTALSLAGGRWSPALLRQHCQDHLEEDFHACAGPTTSLTGGVFDGIKKAIVRSVNDRKFDDAGWYEHREPRITAIVAGVPFAADFDMDSLRTPRAALALISARADRWLVPRFHSERVLQVCVANCTRLVDLPTGGHGALLSPLPPAGGGAIPELIRDPPDFDRAVEVPRLNHAIADYFLRLLGKAP
jgi:predicted dienelactone hydrolase